MLFRHVIPLIVGCALYVGAVPPEVSAQTSPIQVHAPLKKDIFRADLKSVKKKKKAALAQALKPEVSATSDLDVKAPEITFEKDQKVAHAQGGIVVSGNGSRIEADRGKVNLDTKEADVQGRMVLSAPGAQITAEEGSFNLESETGTFRCSDLLMEQGAYRANAEEITKLSEDRYNLKNSTFSTCNCLDDKGAATGLEGCGENGTEKAWSIHSDEVHITRNGYAHAYDSWIDFHGVPVFYSPYVGFPVKEERQSGLLAPTFGYGKRDGLKLEVPLFVVLDESSDIRLSPFTQSRTRSGILFDYRQNFSRYNQLESRFLYSNESSRGESLRGTNVDGIFAPYPDYQYFDDNRFAGHYKQVWRGAPGSDLPMSFITDLNYVGDRLVLREFEGEDFGTRTDRDHVSTAILRTGLGEYGEAELLGEFNQALDDRDQDFVVQRAPELRVGLSKSIRPFGYNPYGVKMVTQLQYLGDEFYRNEGYDGFRSHVVPGVTVPFHYKNYLQGSVGYSYLHTNYYLNDTAVPQISTETSQLGNLQNLDDTNSRDIGIFQAGLGTSIERVFGVEPDSWLTTLTALGSENQENRLVRMKHTFAPQLKFLNIPKVDQSDLPVWDSLGRISEKRALSYGFSTSLYGRFLPINRSQEAIPELVPEIADLPTASSEATPLNEDDTFDPLSLNGGVGLRSGEMRELSRLVIQQAYDFIEDKEDNNPNRDAFSDISSSLYLMPTASFATGIESNYNQETGQFDSIAFPVHFYDDRQDALRARWTMVRDSDSGDKTLSQIEGSVEVKVSERVKLAWYSRFDELNGAALENHGAIRLLSTCNCWHLDLGYGQTANPVDERVELRFTFSGLGDITTGSAVGNRSN